MKKHHVEIKILLSIAIFLFGITFTLISLKASSNSEDLRSYLVRTNSLLTNIPFVEDQDKIDLVSGNPAVIVKQLSNYKELRYNALFPRGPQESQLSNALPASIPIRVRQCIRLLSLDYGTILVQRGLRSQYFVVNLSDKSDQKVTVTNLDSRSCNIGKKYDLVQFSNGVIKVESLFSIQDEKETGRMVIQDKRVFFLSRNAKLSKMSLNGNIQKTKRVLPRKLFSSILFPHSGTKSMLIKSGRIYFTAAIVDGHCALLRIYSVDESTFLDLRTHYSSRCFRDNSLLGGDNYTELNAVGGRLIDDPSNASRIFFSLGNPEIWQGDEVPNQASPLGLVLNLDLGTNKTTLYSRGHRNVQGMCFFENKLYAAEQGPQGGDELNLLGRNNNYGWPDWSYGRPYGVGVTTQFGREFGRQESKESTKPLYSWSPSIAIGAINCAKPNQKSEDFNIVAATLKDESLRILTIFDQKVIQDERIFLNERIREIFLDGKMQSGYFMTDENQIYSLNFKAWKSDDSKYEYTQK